MPQGSGEVAPSGDRPEHEDWPAFVVPWDDVTTGPTDMAGLLKKPAGADGFIQVVDGHLATGDGVRWRFWGVGQVYAAFFPPMDLAGVIARRMAKFGINCLRLTEVQPQFFSVLDQIAGTLNQYPATYVDVVGHADATGSDAYNLGLSQRRAGSVAQYLVGRGVIADRLFVAGEGERRPVASNATEAGRQQNRRVEIVLRPHTARG